jgi:RHS repeat-associated protein
MFGWLSAEGILWELRAPGNGGTGTNLEATDGGGNAYGRVSHSYAGGIDRPLVITKAAVATVVPHQNWRGMFATATLPTGEVSQVAVNWPGFETTPWHKAASHKPNWFGSVTTGMRDASGQIYMRNRYYNPATGQFTQPDPIGLAGGLNSYGFANGDPVSYSDPYGLCPEEMKSMEKKCFSWNQKQVSRALAVIEAERAAGNPHALSVESMTVIGYNAEDIATMCPGTKTGCSQQDGLIGVNADRNPEATSQTIVHEVQHVSAWDTKAGSEPCALRRGVLYVRNMTPANKAAATSGPNPAYVDHPNAGGKSCGF